MCGPFSYLLPSGATTSAGESQCILPEEKHHILGGGTVMAFCFHFFNTEQGLQLQQAMTFPSKKLRSFEDQSSNFYRVLSGSMGGQKGHLNVAESLMIEACGG